MANIGEKVEGRGRGFAGMDRERQRQISSQGGKAAHQKGTAHEFDSGEARAAGRKGGMVSGGRRRAREGIPGSNGSVTGNGADTHSDQVSRADEAAEQRH